MNTLKNYYLVIPVTDIWVKVKKDNIVISDGKKATDIFNALDIPKEFQKIVLKISIGGMNTPKDAFELTTNEMFYFKIPIIKAILNSSKYDKLEILSHHIDIYTKISFYHADKVKEFYQGIIDAKLALNYEKAVYHMFGKEYKQENGLATNKILRKEHQ